VASTRKNLKKVQEQLQNLQKERAKILRIFYRDEPLIAGSYSEVFMRCGKATCRCHQDGGHFATRLSKWTRGKLKTKIVRVDDRERVRKASDHYKSHKSVLRDLKKLHTEELNMLKRIVELKTTEYE
jgi:hypothetical protein